MAAINPSNKRRERQIAIALQDRTAAKMQRDLGGILQRTYRDAASRYEATGKLSSVDAAVSAQSEVLRRALLAGVTRAATTFAERTADNARKQANDGDVVLKASPLMTRVNQKLLEFIRRHVAKRVTQIDDTTRDHIKNAVQRGRDNGQSVTEIARVIRDAAPTISSTRAHLISRTETHTAANEGAVTAAGELGIELTKEWVSAGDDRVRDDHADVNGQTVAMGEDFDVGGEAMRYPGDPDGSAANVINCRCAVIFNS